MSPPTIGRFSFDNRILRPINGLRYTRQPSCIFRASSRLTSLHSLSADDPPRAMEKTQRERFIEAARELECDEDEDALKARIKRLAETKPAPSKSLVKKPRRKPG